MSNDTPNSMQDDERVLWNKLSELFEDYGKGDPEKEQSFVRVLEAIRDEIQGANHRETT